MRFCHFARMKLFNMSPFLSNTARFYRTATNISEYREAPEFHDGRIYWDVCLDTASEEGGLADGDLDKLFFLPCLFLAEKSPVFAMLMAFCSDLLMVILGIWCFSGLGRCMWNSLDRNGSGQLAHLRSSDIVCTRVI